MAKKYKILVLSDHALSSSGVGCQTRFLIQGLLATNKYSFRCFGAAVKHEDYKTIVVNDDFIIKPTDGFGTVEMIRQVLATEKPDAMFLFTDPRFFGHVFSMEEEIHQICPITYNTLWDNTPVPQFNKVIYDICDLVNCINYPTYEFVHNWFPEKTNYIPHAVPKEIYHPISDEDKLQWKIKLLGQEKKDNFVALYVGRNARRKMVPDIIRSWKQFTDYVKKTYGHNNVTLLMHTDPFDHEGTNLHVVCEAFDIDKETIIFSKERIEFDMMNIVYNICDVQINFSSAEGFGLPVLEGKMSGLPAIAIKTGGLTRQVEDHIDGTNYGVALEPDVKNCVGNVLVSYIFEDLCSVEHLTEAIIKMYETSPEDSQILRQKCIEHAHRDYSMDYMISKWDETLTNTIENWKKTYKPWEHIEL
jgi:glycosyltransferase involved in cell wall biosynthesis